MTASRRAVFAALYPSYSSASMAAAFGGRMRSLRCLAYRCRAATHASRRDVSSRDHQYTWRRALPGRTRGIATSHISDMASWNHPASSLTSAGLSGDDTQACTIEASRRSSRSSCFSAQRGPLGACWTGALEGWVETSNRMYRWSE
ncbi:unnamed protein product [Parnassius mnemosyne]|uniref:Uncharacterized protein n=1 Tax=Parnassius mnemosyne TaxID=213953 RepID=A0AAV1LXY2_9NEOP